MKHCMTSFSWKSSKKMYILDGMAKVGQKCTTEKNLLANKSRNFSFKGCIKREA